MEHACARRATHRGYCAGSLSHNGAWALTSYQRGLAWVGRKPGWVQRAHVTPYTRQIVSRDTVSEAPAPPPCLGLVGEEATFTSAGLYPRHFPRPGSTPAAAPGLYASTAGEKMFCPRNFRPAGHFLQSHHLWKARVVCRVTYITCSSDARTSMITFHLLTYLFLAMQDIYWEQRRAFCNN